MDKAKLYLSHTDEGIELTREEYAEADVEIPWRFERANGRLVVMTPPGIEHHITVESFRDSLIAFKLAHPDIVKHIFQASWTAVQDDADRLPDIAVYPTGETGSLPDRVPELIVECVSSGFQDRKRDFEEKRSEYERIRVQEIRDRRSVRSPLDRAASRRDDFHGNRSATDGCTRAGRRSAV